MSALTQTFQWLAMSAGFANALSFLPQMWRLYQEKTSQGISLISYIAWLFILGISVTHLFLQADYWYGIGLASSWFTCFATFLMAAYYRRRGQTIEELVQQYIAGWRTSNAEMILSTLAPDCEIIESHGPAYRGLKAVERWIHDWSRTGSIEVWTTAPLHVSDATATFEWDFVCTVTGERKHVTGCSVVRVVGGKIASLHEYRLTKQPD